MIPIIVVHVIAMIVVIVIVRAADHASPADEADYKQDRNPTDAFACVGHFVSKSVLPRTEFIAMQSMSQLTRSNRAGDRGRSLLPLTPRFAALNEKPGRVYRPGTRVTHASGLYTEPGAPR